MGNTSSWSNRTTFQVPSPHHQTLLSKCLFEFGDLATVAAVATSSKIIQTSSLAANCAINIAIDDNTIPLFLTVFHPASALPIQFVPHLRFHRSNPKISAGPGFVELLSEINAGELKQEENTDKKFCHFIAALRKTKYFGVSLRSLDVDSVTVNSGFLEACFENNNNNNYAGDLTALQTLWLKDYPISAKEVKILNNHQHSNFEIKILGRSPKAAMFVPYSNLTRITHLSLHRAPDLSDIAVRNSIENFEHVRTLDLEHCYNFTEETMALFASSLPNLVSLKLSACSITDAGLKFFENNDMISSLNVSNCLEITDLSLESISTLRSIVKLDIGGCPKITDSGLLLHISKMKQLKKLFLDRSSPLLVANIKISEEAQSQLVMMLPNLETVTIFRHDVQEFPDCQQQ